MVFLSFYKKNCRTYIIGNKLVQFSFLTFSYFGKKNFPTMIDLRHIFSWSSISVSLFGVHLKSCYHLNNNRQGQGTFGARSLSSFSILPSLAILVLSWFIYSVFFPLSFLSTALTFYNLLKSKLLLRDEIATHQKSVLYNKKSRHFVSLFNVTEIFLEEYFLPVLQKRIFNET